MYVTIYHWGKENRSLYLGLRDIVVHYIEVSLYFTCAKYVFPWFSVREILHVQRIM